MDSREIYYEHTTDVMGHQGNPIVPPERVLWLWAGSNKIYNDTYHRQCTRPGNYLECSIEVYVPPPEYHVGGPDAINKVKDQMDAYMIKAFSQVIENLDSNNIIRHWSLTPWEQEFRNTGLLGGTWYGPATAVTSGGTNGRCLSSLDTVPPLTGSTSATRLQATPAACA